MNHVRRVLASAARLLLAVHLLAGALPIALIWEAPLAYGEVGCTCVNGPDADCPMHRHPVAPTPGPHCRGCQPTDDHLSVPMFAWGGTLAPAVVHAVRLAPAEQIVAGPQFASDRAFQPISPPPRLG